MSRNLQNKTSRLQLKQSVMQLLNGRRCPTIISVSGTKKVVELLSVHYQIFEKVSSRIEVHWEQTNEGVDRVLKFLRDKVAHDTVYAKYLTESVPLLSKAFYDTDNKVTLYETFSKGLRESDEYHNKLGKAIAGFATFVETGVVKEVTGVTETAKARVKTLMDRISYWKAETLKIKSQNERVSHKYNKVYQIGVQGVKPKKREDLLNWLLEAIRQNVLLVSIHRLIGKETAALWSTVIEVETQRMEALRKGFISYFKKYKEIFGTDCLAVPLLETFVPQTDVEKYLGLTAILEETELEYIKKMTSNPEPPTLKDVSVFLENFEVEPFNEQHLLRRVFHVQRDHGILKSFRDCWLVLTVDEFLLIFDEAKDPRLEPRKSDSQVDLTRTTAQFRADSLVVTIIETTPGLIIDGSRRIPVKFPRKDEMDEFLYYINRQK
eukprot:TRINITY_DN2683_c0_g2_i2.p1 TRINITY_DN2683_c0_g2~~TRINITY_DN2683_c0_g2_i2.p1  ORF type:complete len:436 (+),score=85.24 TRINITY_DN2683_c0_g2_i2:310-1617(+)